MQSVLSFSFFRFLSTYFVVALLLINPLYAIVLDDFIVDPEVSISLDEASEKAAIVIADPINSEFILDSRTLRLGYLDGSGQATLSVTKNFAGNVSQATSQTSYHEFDINKDGAVTPLDVLLISNHINAQDTFKPDYDVNGDGYISPIDALIIINALKTSDKGSIEVEGSIDSLSASDVPSVRLVSSPNVAAVATIEYDGDENADSFSKIGFTKNGHTPINLKARGGSAFQFHAQYNAPRGEATKISIALYTGEENSSLCEVELDTNTSQSSLSSSETAYSIPYSSCFAATGNGARFEAVTAMKVILNESVVPGAEVSFALFTNNVEGFGDTEGGDVGNGDGPDQPSSPVQSASPESSSSPRSNISNPPASLPPSPSSSPSVSPEPPCQAPCGCTPDGTPIEKDSCDVCGGDGTSCQKTCPDGVNAILVTMDQPWGTSAVNWTEIRALGRSTSQGQCLNSALDQALRECEPARNMRNSYGQRNVFYDDCVASYMIGNTGQSFYGWRTPSPFNGTRKVLWEERDHYDRWGNYRGKKMVQFVAGHVFVDQNCNTVPIEDEDLIAECLAARIDYAGSPISLILDESYYDEESTIVPFSLDPLGCKNCYSEWKSSEVAPLLVYDPEHTGVVKDARQLFGNWTFGGNTFASLIDGGRSSKWEHGFKALGTLDRNFDGKVSGAELQDLALWFDGNKNGISENGEVVPLKNADVTALYYQGEFRDEVGNVVLKKGFERTVDGKVQYGTAIDWYGKMASSPKEVLNHISASRSFDSLSPVPNELDVSELDHSATIDSEKAKPQEGNNKPLDGAWDWKAVLSGGVEISGTFVLREQHNGFVGYSFFQNEIPIPDVPSLNMLNVARIKGSIQDKKYTFTLSTHEGTVMSYMHYISDKDELEGETKVLSGDKNMTYRWVAHRRDG